MKWPFSHVFCLLYSDFSAKSTHVELCDWLDSFKATSSGHFSYLSAGRSWLRTFILDETIREVSTSFPPYLYGRVAQPAWSFFGAKICDL